MSISDAGLSHFRLQHYPDPFWCPDIERSRFLRDVIFKIA
jgi:hypothetical protein